VDDVSEDGVGPAPGVNGAGDGVGPTRRYARYVLFMIFVVTLLNVLDRSIVAILLEEIRVDLGASDRAMGFLAGLGFSIVHVAAATPIARWADRGVRRSILAGGVHIWSGATAASGLVHSYLQLLVARSVVGISEAAGGPPSQSLLADYFPPERRATAMALNSVGAALGIALGLLIGGLIGREYGWRRAFLCAGLPGIAFAILFRLTVREPRRGGLERGHKAPPVTSTKEGLAMLFRRRSLVLLIVAAGFHNFVAFSLSIWTPTFLIRLHGMDMATAGLALVVTGPTATALGAFLGGQLTDRLAKRDVRWTMYIPACGAFLAIPWMAAFVMSPASATFQIGSTQLPIALLFYSVGSGFAGAYAGATWAMAQTLAPVSVRVLAAAVLTIVANLIGQGMGPFSVGWISTALSDRAGEDALRYALLTPVAALFVAGCLNLLSSRHLRHDLEADHL